MSAKENRAAWVAALRSGNYEQCRGTLQNEGRYCCLGVACRLAEAAGEPAALRLGEASSLAGGNLIVQPAVKEWLALPAGFAMHLATLNDDKRCSFDEIADYIEKELL